MRIILKYALLIVLPALPLLAQGEQRAGYHAIVWPARDRTRRKVSSGIYFARLVTPDGVRAIKMVLLK